MLTARGIELLRIVQKRLRRKPAGFTFDMGTYAVVDKLDDGERKASKHAYEFAEGFCGTSGCIAGTLALEACKTDGVTIDTTATNHYGARGFEGFLYNGEPFSVPDLAIKLLGCSENAALQLFEPWDYPSKYWVGLSENKKTDVAEAIERFIANNGRSAALSGNTHKPGPWSNY